MSRVVEINFDCGFVVTYPVVHPPTRLTRRTFELSADLEHANKCQTCKQKMNEEERTSTS